jgi:hypothetical protein
VGTIKATIPLSAPISAVLSPPARQARLEQIRVERAALRLTFKDRKWGDPWSLTPRTTAELLQTVKPAEREAVVRMLQRAAALEGEERALMEPPPPPEPAYVPPRGPSLDELNLGGFGSNLRLLLTPLQQPQPPVVIRSPQRPPSPP